jgi:hypothetical protein
MCSIPAAIQQLMFSVASTPQPLHFDPHSRSCSPRLCHQIPPRPPDCMSRHHPRLRPSSLHFAILSPFFASLPAMTR